MNYKTDNIKIKKYHIGQELLIQQLIRKVFDEFVATDYCEEGNRFFYDWIEPSRITARQKNILLAMCESKIVDMIEIRDNNWISLLFVDKEYQRQGIAKKLIQKSLRNSIQKDADLDKFYVHASPFSIPIYKKLGFIETSEMQEKNGIKYLPMEMIIKK
jgi:predicted GNAT family N-acyltransferase